MRFRLCRRLWKSEFTTLEWSRGSHHARFAHAVGRGSAPQQQLHSRRAFVSSLSDSAVMRVSAGRDHQCRVSGVADPEHVALDPVRGSVLERCEELRLLLHYAGRALAQLAGAGQGSDLEGAVPALEGSGVAVAPGVAAHTAAGVEAHRQVGAGDERDHGLVAVVVADDPPHRTGEPGRSARRKGHGPTIELELEYQIATVE